MTRIFGIMIAVLFLSVGHTASAQFSSELLNKAQGGDAEAQSALGDIYYYGEGVEQDYAEAVKWWQMAAEQGNAKAQVSLGYVYSKGIGGVGQDYVKSIKWYRLAAEQGDAAGQMGLGLTYYSGRGEIQDLVYSHLWFNITASSGREYAAILRDLAAEKMTPEQIAVAEKLAEECVRKEYKDC